jgi:proliferating cell nuclear antigen
MNIVIQNKTKADIFVSLFQYISKFTDNMNLMFENERFYMQSINTSHVVILEICLPKEWFDIYEITEGSIIIGVNTSLFYKVLKKREKTQQINICYNNTENTDRLQFYFTDATTSSTDELTEEIQKGSKKEDVLIFDKDFEIPLIDIDEELLSIPEMEYQAELSLSTDKFANLISQLKDFGETLEIECSEDKITLSSNSSENGKMITRILIEDLTEFSIEENEIIQMEFALKYLYDICLYQKISKTMDLKISKDFPMRIMYPLGNSNEEKDATFLFYLAPKMGDSI